MAMIGVQQLLARSVHHGGIFLLFDGQCRIEQQPGMDAAGQFDGKRRSRVEARLLCQG